MAPYTKVYYDEMFGGFRKVLPPTWMLVTGPDMGGTAHCIGSKAHCRAQAVWLKLRDFRIIQA